MVAAALLLAAAPAASLAPLRDFAGHCWRAEIANGVTDRHCFKQVYDGAHIRDEHVVERDGQLVYAGETLYSVVDGRIVFTYWNSLGGVGQGTAKAKDGTLTFRLTMRATPTATPAASVSVWRKTADGYEATTDGVTRRFRRND